RNALTAFLSGRFRCYGISVKAHKPASHQIHTGHDAACHNSKEYGGSCNSGSLLGHTAVLLSPVFRCMVVRRTVILHPGSLSPLLLFSLLLLILSVMAVAADLVRIFLLLFAQIIIHMIVSSL